MGDADVDQVRRLRAGEAAAFRELASRLAPRLRAAAMRYFRSPFEQEEAVQEALLQVFKVRDQLDPLRADTMDVWVMTVAERRMIDLQRSAAARPASADEPVPETPAERTPEDDARDAELRAVVASFEEKLKPAWRPYFRAVFVEGRDFDEARVALGLGRLRAKYLKQVLLGRMRRHRPLLEALGRLR